MRVLADGRLKLTALTTAPLDPAAPTITELNAGIDLSCKVLSENFLFGATDSDKIAEKALCDTANSNALGASNYQAGFTLWRQFDVAGGFDVDEDEAFEALKEKGTEVYLYARLTDKLATEPWAADDEIFLGALVATDEPQRTEGGGFIKYRIPGEVQRSWPFIAAATGV